MSKWIVRLGGVFLALVLLAAGPPMGARAEAAADRSSAIGFEIDDDGSWKVVELFGQTLDLDPRAFHSLARVLGLQVELPTQIMEPELVAKFKRARVEQLAIELEGESARIWLDDGALLQATVHLSTLENLLPEQLVQPFGFLRQVMRFVPGSVSVRFTPQPFAVSDPATAKAAAPTTDPVNLVQLEATVNPSGEMLSAAGFTAEEAASLGVELPTLSPTLATLFAGFDRVAVDAAPDGMTVSTDGLPVLELLWDQDGRRILLAMARDFGDASADGPMFDLVDTLLASSRLHLDLYVAEEPQDGPPTIEIGDPIVVTLGADSMLRVAGVPAGSAGAGRLAALAERLKSAGVDQVQICWDAGHLYLKADGKPLPHISTDRGWLTTLLALAGLPTDPLADKLELALAELEVPVAVLLDPAAAVRVDSCGGHQLADAPPPVMGLDVQGTWNRQSQELAVDKFELPLGTLGTLPMNIAGRFRVPDIVATYVPTVIDHVDASLGASGLRLGLGDVDLGIHWDATALSRLAEVLGTRGFGETMRQLLPILDAAEFNVDLDVTGEAAATSR